MTVRKESSCHQLGNRTSVIHNRRRSAVEIPDEGVGGIDAEVMINRCKEVAGTANPLDRIFAALIGRADKPPGLQSAAKPDIRIGPRPVIAAGLHRSGGSAGVSSAGARRIINFR